MSAGQDNLDYLIEKYVEEPFREIITKRNEQSAIKQQRFYMFFFSPEHWWMTAQGEWIPVSKMDRSHMINILYRNKHVRPLKDVMEPFAAIAPKGLLGESFKDCETWEDAMEVIFKAELDQRAKSGKRW